MSERELFESLICSLKGAAYISKFENGTYKDVSIRVAWETWSVHV